MDAPQGFDNGYFKTLDRRSAVVAFEPVGGGR
jgi:hypothetical protein